MKHTAKRHLRRRQFLGAMARGTAAAGIALSPRISCAMSKPPLLEAGQGVVDITPPLGIDMGGYHRAPGNERRITGIRQPTAVRALVLRVGQTQAAIVSMDICAAASDVAQRVRGQIAKQLGIPGRQVHLCCTHTHSMPAFCYLRQWGSIPKKYMALVEKRVVEAVKLAKADLAPAELSVGKSPAIGANFNRTAKTWKTEEQFGKDSTDEGRWLDRMVRVMHFGRGGSRPDLLWYHFSAHAVCYADELAGPDWPGLVDQRILRDFKLTASFLQGHAGDVNPGDGEPWRGDHEKTTKGVYDAIAAAMNRTSRVKVDELRLATCRFEVPLDMKLFVDWLARYRKDPSKCKRGEWVDAGFAEDWFQDNSKRDLTDTHLPITLGAIRLGELGLIFHPAELYSYYGLAIQRDSPLGETVVVGYADGIIGYLPDPKAYEAGEYAAITVPKILDFPPFTPTAGRQMSAAAVDLLKQVTA